MFQSKILVTLLLSVPEQLTTAFSLKTSQYPEFKEKLPFLKKHDRDEDMKTFLVTKKIRLRN